MRVNFGRVSRLRACERANFARVNFGLENTKDIYKNPARTEKKREKKKDARSDEMLSLLTRARGRWNGDLQPSVNSIKGKYGGITIQNNVNAGALTQVDSIVLLS